MLNRKILQVMVLALSLGLLLPCLGQVTAAVASESGLDLAVGQVWVGNDCQVNVRLVRLGPARLPSKMAKLTALRIKLGNRTHDFSFKDVDPSGSLLQGPATVNFHSPVKIEGPAVITAMADPLDKLEEKVERSNNIKSIKVSGKGCQAPSAGIKGIEITSAFLEGPFLGVAITHARGAKIPKQELPRISLRVQVHGLQGTWPLSRVYSAGRWEGRNLLRFNTRLKAKPGMQVRTLLKRGKAVEERSFTLAAGTTTAQEQVAKGGGVAKGGSHGIMIFKPTSRKIGRRGGTLGVLYGVSRDAPEGWIEFSLRRGPQVFNTIRVHHQPSEGSAPAEQQIAFPIPRQAAYGPGYFIRAEMGSSWGESDQFRIEPFGDSSSAGARTFEIKVVAPSRAGTSWPQGSTHMLSWHLLGDYFMDPEDASFTVTLLKAGLPVMTIDSSSREWHANTRTYTMNWTIPSDLAYGDDYRIKVADRASPEEDLSDEPFTITGPISVFIEPEYYESNPMSIRWEIQPGFSINSVKIDLIRTDGVVHYNIWNTFLASMGSCIWPVGANLRSGDGFVYRQAQGEMLRGLWKIRVSDVRHPEIYGDSQEFLVKTPRMDVSTSETRHGRRITWSTAHLSDSSRVTIYLSYRDPNFRFNQHICIARDMPVNGVWEWRYGNTCDPGYYPEEILPTRAHILITVRGFYEAGVGGFSTDFDLDE